jgi:hypothetical protein
VRIAGAGVLQVEDRMNPTDLASYDIFLTSCTAARAWGIRRELVTIVGKAR